MTENVFQEFFVALEGLQAGIVRRAGDLGEDAAATHAVADDLAEMKVAAIRMKLPQGFIDAFSAVRLRVADLEARLVQRGLDEAGAAEALTRIVGGARAAADTIEIDIAEVAAAKD